MSSQVNSRKVPSVRLHTSFFSPADDHGFHAARLGFQVRWPRESQAPKRSLDCLLLLTESVHLPAPVYASCIVILTEFVGSLCVRQFVRMGLHRFCFTCFRNVLVLFSWSRRGSANASQHEQNQERSFQMHDTFSNKLDLKYKPRRPKPFRRPHTRSTPAAHLSLA
jgi:hypothetical protein